MAKISIITLQGIRNYGSALQTFATQKIFEKYGFDVEIINYTRVDAKTRNLLNSFTVNDSFFKKIFKYLLLIPSIMKQNIVFSSFLRKYIRLSHRKYSNEIELENNPPVADIYCTGSDQVWNFDWNKGFKPEFYLAFAPRGKRRISFSASIGRDDFDESEKQEVRKYLNLYDNISVRETKAINILENLGIKNSSHVIDPTLLFPRDFWINFASKRKIKGNYVLVYQLNKNDKFDKFAVEFAKRKKCKLIRLCYRFDQIRLPGQAIVLPRVPMFVSLIENASFVITDSFHVTAFSLNLNKEIIAIYPKKFSSRLDDLLTNTNTISRHLIDYSNYEICEKKLNYEDVNNYFKVKRSEAEKFLKIALGLKDE